MRWIGALLLPLFGAAACFIVLMLGATSAVSSGASWTRSFQTSRMVDSHLDLTQIIYAVLAVHGLYVIFLAIRAAASSDAKALHPLLFVPIAAVLSIPIVIFGFSVPLGELRHELPIGVAMAGLPLLVMIAIAERVVFGSRTPPPAPEPTSRWAGPPRTR